MTDLEKTRTDLQIDQLVEAFRNDLTSRSIAIAKKGNRESLDISDVAIAARGLVDMKSIEEDFGCELFSEIANLMIN